MAGTEFGYRGFMLDVCRHYMPADEIRKLLDAAHILGLNRFHWHLSDDQGWRIEIRKYPKLTEVGSVFRRDAGEGAQLRVLYSAGDPGHRGLCEGPRN